MRVGGGGNVLEMSQNEQWNPGWLARGIVVSPYGGTEWASGQNPTAQTEAPCHERQG